MNRFSSDFALTAPRHFHHDQFTLLPAGPRFAAMDWAALNSSVKELQQSHGWFVEANHDAGTIEDNKETMEESQEKFNRGSGYDFVVLAPDQKSSLGGVNLLPVGTQLNHSVEIDYWLSTAVRGRDIDTHLVQTLLTWLTSGVWGFKEERISHHATNSSVVLLCDAIRNYLLTIYP